MGLGVWGNGWNEVLGVLRHFFGFRILRNKPKGWGIGSSG